MSVVSHPPVEAAADVPRGDPGVRTPDAGLDLRDVIAGGGVRTVFQPIVDLDTGRSVAFEALTRGPEGPYQRPDLLFRAGREQGLLAELDQACRVSALRHAIRLNISGRSTVFINVEPEVVDSAPLAVLAGMLPPASGPGRVVLEVTERALARRPASLMRTVDLARSLGWGIALDDVGVDPASLAFLSLLEPDVVKLDMGLIQHNTSQVAAQVMHCVNAYAERSGARVLAEGIETPRHLDNARALGASLGQGWLFGRPASDPEVPMTSTTFVTPAQHRVDNESPYLASPFAALPPAAALRRAPKRLLIELSKNLEQEAARIGETSIVAATFQHARHFTTLSRARYAKLSRQAGFVCILGEGLPADPLPGVRGADLASGDPVRDEWDLVVLSPHFAVALLARDIGSEGPEMERDFEFALTYDRDTVVKACHSLLGRVAAADVTHI